MKEKYDIVVIGSGPGGYVAAGRAAREGFQTLLIEKDRLGGVCLNWGCIPTKALLESAHVYELIRSASRFGLPDHGGSRPVHFADVIERSRNVAARMSKGVSYLMKQRGVDVIFGKASLVGEHEIQISMPDGEHRVSAGYIIIATGASPRSLPGIDIDHRVILDSRDMLLLKEVPEHIVIVGAGPIGMEFAEIYHSFGARITIVEMMNSILPQEESDIVTEVNRSLRRKKITVLTQHTVEKVTRNEGKFLDIDVKGKRGVMSLQADMMLLSAGVRPNIRNMGLETTGIRVKTDGFIVVDRYYRTTVENIFAIGDVTGPPMLAHKASAEAIGCIDFISGRKRKNQLNPDHIPRCTYCRPQVASVGLTEKQARDKGIEVFVGRCPFRANGRSISMNETDGLVKLVFNKENKKLIGAHICHALASELIAELCVVMNQGGDVSWLEQTVHAHPTLSEAVWEAAAAALGRSVHL